MLPAMGARSLLPGLPGKCLGRLLSIDPAGWAAKSEETSEGLMLKLKLQYIGHLMGRVDSSEKTLVLGQIEGRRRRGQERMR